MTKITEHFKKKEMACKHCGKVKYDIALMAKLELVRLYLNEPITINSGYRCEIHNKNVGGAKNSLHLKGKAVDIRAKNQKELIRIVEKVFTNGGIGYYKSFIHVDVGPKRRWNG